MLCIFLCSTTYKSRAYWHKKYLVENIWYVVRVSILTHVVDNVLYVVDICCGGLTHVVECIACGCTYVVDTVHILWGYVVDNIHSSYIYVVGDDMLWVTFFCVVHNICWCSPQHTYICCGDMLWSTSSFTDVQALPQIALIACYNIIDIFILTWCL